VRAPSVHLNGTSRDALVRQYEAAEQGLRAALEGLCETAPNGRDYYVQGGGAFAEAQDAHYSRVDRVRAVLDEIEALHLEVMS
jgi:hypothetical protein